MSSCCGKSLQNCIQRHALLYFYPKAIVFYIQPKSCDSICTVIGVWRDIELIECFSPCKRLESVGKLLVLRSTLYLTQDFFGGEHVGSEGSYWLYRHGIGRGPVGDSLEDSSRWTASAVGSHCSCLSEVPGRGFPFLLFLKSSCPARVAVEPNWSQVRHSGDLLHYLCTTTLGKGGEEVPFKEYSQPLSWSSSYGLGPGLTKALSNGPEAWLLLSLVFTKLEACLNLPLHGCHPEISSTSELRPDVQEDFVCYLLH